MGVVPGQRLGHYRLERQLGERLFCARDELLSRSVVIELLTRETLGRARAIAKIAHPNLASMLELAVDEEPPFAVTELIEGRSTAAMIAGALPLPAYTTIHIVTAVASALDAYHAAGIAHGGVRPANIIVERASGRIVLAPVERSEPISIAADVRALAATAYELFTGRSLETPRPRADDVVPSLGWRVERAIGAALAPHAQPESALELASDLSRAVKRRRHPIRVLLVDDCADHRTYFTSAIARRLHGSVVDAVSDGETGFHAAVCTRPDVVIVDLAMPGMDGIELTRALRGAHGLERLPIIVASGEIGDRERRELAALDAAAIIEKPTPPWRLVDAIRDALGLPSRASGIHPQIEIAATRSSWPPER